jgi:hypothetical protein
MDKEKIQILKRFFLVSTAGFDFQKAIMISLGKEVYPSEMEILHRFALKELENIEPSVHIMNELLLRMEQIAEFNKNSKK